MKIKFVHLHNHTEYSLLDGLSKISDLIEKAQTFEMPAIGISDHGNLFGVPEFVLTAQKAGIHPIIGCEFYLIEGDIHEKKNKEKRYHQILFAKNEQGYKNLMKLSSIAYVEGFYHKPRINKALIERYREGLIATTCCIQSEINQKILQGRIEEAKQIFLWYLERFGEDFYVEIQRHGLKNQDKCNHILIQWAKEYNVPIIATNDIHYVNQDDAQLHDILLAVQTGERIDSKKRLRFTDDDQQLNPNFYLKSPEEMYELFKDIPEALTNTLALADKCQYVPRFAGELILPIYQVPKEFSSMDDYLSYLSFEGAKKRYGEPLPVEVSERLEHELAIIKKMGFAGYFLIVQEFTSEARKRGVMVGPGRGSAAGSLVAYCLGITDIDPLKYDLLFERFLNPERISPPDIDIDFDDEGRSKVIQFVVEKYGRKAVSQIITFGTMGAKTAIKDVGRAFGLSPSETDAITKLIPGNLSFKDALDPQQNPKAHLLQAYFKSDNEKIRQTLYYAQRLEGTIRHTGVHAAGVIIAPGELTNYVPLAVGKEKNGEKKDHRVVVTQFDGPNAELAGLLKMDFLGLKTLSIIKTALKLIEKNHGVKIDIENIDLNDKKTYELYQRGETIATFQFESQGMRSYLKQLKPTCIEDLIAMNALYRPGPMEYIPVFIRRKHGEEPVEYPHPKLEPILKNTYGIMVYQEQIMQTAQVLAGYTLGEADLLRRAMGKKKVEVMKKERQRFVQRAMERGLSKEKAEEIFDIMERFAQYGFNKSHAAAYSILAFRTAYLKAHYPAEYMTAVLSHWNHDVEKIRFFIEECRRMGIAVLPPSVNESDLNFSVNKKGEIRFGLLAIKGVGIKPAEAIIQNRKKLGPFKDLGDFLKRLDTTVINKRVLEALVEAGALDCLGIPRSVYKAQHKEKKYKFIDALLKIHKQLNKTPAFSSSLFGEESEQMVQLPDWKNDFDIPELSPIETLFQERERTGFFLSAHPLDRYKSIIKKVAFTDLKTFFEQLLPKWNEQYKPGQQLPSRVIDLFGVICEAEITTSKSGKRFATFLLEDFESTYTFRLFGERFVRCKNKKKKGNIVVLRGKVVPSFKDENTLEYRIDSIQPLEDYINTLVRITIHLPVEQMTEEQVLVIKEAVKHYAIEKRSNSKQKHLALCFIYESRKMGVRFTAASKRYFIPLKEDASELNDFLDKLAQHSIQAYLD